jgi:hypothetical protein
MKRASATVAVTFGLSLLGLGLTYSGHTQTGAPTSAPVVSCEGPFAKDSTHQKLVEAFGEQNVAYLPVDVPGATTPWGRTIIYPNDAVRRLAVNWNDQAARARPFSFTIVGTSEWRGPKGVRIGMTLEQLEETNGRPFTITGYNGVDGMTFFKDGALTSLPGGCVVNAILRPTVQLPDDQLKGVSGDHQISSSDPTIRAAKPKVVVVDVRP